MVLTLECDRVAFNGLDGSIRDDRLASFENRCDADFLPLNRNLTEELTKLNIRYERKLEMIYIGSGVNIFNGLADFRTNTLTFKGMSVS